MTRTVVEEMVASIAHDILRGVYAPGDRLPPFRALAETFGVTLPTAQRAVGRVDELGLITVRQGRGATVLDPYVSAHPGVLPYWVDAVLGDPPKACAIVSDFLEVRRELAALLVVRLRSADLEPVVEAVDTLERVVSGSGTVPELVAADLTVVRAMLAAAPSVVLASVFNAFSALLEAIEPLAEAMYAEPAMNVAGYRGVLALAASAEPELIRTAIPAALRALDEATVSRFRSNLEERCLDS